MTGSPSRLLRRSSFAPAFALALVLGGLPVPARAADVPAKGTGDSLGRLRHPPHLRSRSPQPVLRLRLRADGGARRAAGAALRAGARTRRGVLRRAVPGRRQMGADQRASRSCQAVGSGAERGVRTVHPGLRRRPQRLGGGAPGRTERRGQGGAAADRGGRLRARPAHHPLRLGGQPAATRAAAHPLRQRRARVQRMGHRAIALRHRQGAALEQLAPAVGRHPHLFRGAADRARRHVLRRRLGRLPGAASVLHRVRGLDPDHQQPVRVRPLSARAQGRRLRARRRGEIVRDAHRDRSRSARPTVSCATSRSRSAAACMDRWWPSAAGRPLPCAWRRSIVPACSSSSGGWAWRRTSKSGRQPCACSSCRSSTPPTPTGTATSRTSTTPRCRCMRPATTGSGRVWCPAIART